MAVGDEGDLKLTEERLARLSVLQELTVLALDLFDPRRSMDDFLDRLAMRLGCVAAICLGPAERGHLRLLGAAGLSRASRVRPVAIASSLDELRLPYAELADPHLVRWHFRVSAPEGSDDALGSLLLLFFEGEPRLPAQYHGVVERLADILHTALLHRSLYARTIESERQLFEQKTLLECQSEASLDAILFVSTDGQASYNGRFREVFELPEQVGGFADLLEPIADKIASPADLIARLERLSSSREARGRTEVVFHDGRSFDVAYAPVRSVDGVFFGRSWYLREITDHKRVELERALLFQQEQLARERAEEARRRSTFLAEASRMLAASLDHTVILEAVAHLAVPAIADWCMVDILSDEGLTQRVALAHADPTKAELARRLRASFPPDPRVPAGAGRVLADGQPQLWEEIDTGALGGFVREEEHLRLLQGLGLGSALVVPMTARGRTLGAITLVHGDSGRRYSEADLVLAEDLASRAALAVDNARLYQRMQEAVRARDEFLSIASHELRTPVTSLHLAAQGLLRSVNAGTLAHAPESFLRSSLETAVRQSSRMAKLVDRLLDVSRIEAGRLELQLEQVDLSTLVLEAVASARDDLERAGCAARVRTDAHVVGRWDRQRLEQVVTNLLTNAIKYGAGKPIDLSVETVDGLARLTVRDHGIGIPADQCERIFERFERAASARHYSGLGLGLYIVERVLTAHGGTVQVRSEPGEGSAFVVELPLEVPETEAEPCDGGERGAA